MIEAAQAPARSIADIVLKIGGSLLDDARARRAAVEGAARLVHAGHRVVVVHGGGRAISRALDRLGLRSEFRDGLRVTTPDSMEAIAGVLAGVINKELVAELAGFGVTAVGLCGVDGGTLVARRDDGGLGLVGTPESADPRLVTALLDRGMVPVISSIAADRAGQMLNVNADAAAAAVAAAVGAARLVFLSDTPGVVGSSESTIRLLTAGDVDRLKRDGILSGGMMPKAGAALAALDAGIGTVVIAGSSSADDVVRAALGSPDSATFFARAEADASARRTGLSAPLRARVARGEIDAIPGLSHDFPEAAPLDEIARREETWLLQTYDRYPISVAGGNDSRIRDAEGREVVDFLAGIAVNALGFAHPRLVEALRAAASQPWHTSNLLYHPYQGLLAERLCQLSRLSRAFFTNSGAEAVEAALKVARARGTKSRPGKYGVVAAAGSFHGRTFGALSMTSKESYRAPFGPELPGAAFVPMNDVAALEAAVGDRTCAVILEPVQGESGVHAATAEYLAAARRLCDRHDALLILDEIQCGLGRTGALFAFEHAGVLPDLVTIAKALAGGLPLGALLAGPRAAESLARGAHGTTFGGGPLACRVALAFLDVLDEERLCDRALRLGARLLNGLETIQRARPEQVTAVRGRGLMIGVDTTHDARTLALALLAEGFLVGTSGERTIRLLPPLIITETDIDLFCGAFGRVLAECVSLS